MPRLLAAIAIVLVAQGVPALGQNAGQKPDPAALARAGQESIKRFEKESASWTTTTVVRPGIGFVVEVVANLTTRRAVLSVEFQGQREELARITQKDGVWYAKQGNKTGKYRPFEAPLDAPKNSARPTIGRTSPASAGSSRSTQRSSPPMDRSGTTTPTTPPWGIVTICS